MRQKKVRVLGKEFTIKSAGLKGLHYLVWIMRSWEPSLMEPKDAARYEDELEFAIKRLFELYIVEKEEAMKLGLLDAFALLSEIIGFEGVAPETMERLASFRKVRLRKVAGPTRKTPEIGKAK